MSDTRRPTVLVTGASRGIGRACARALAASGWRLRLVARSGDLLEEIVRLLPGEGHRWLAADLAAPDGRRRLNEWCDGDVPDAIVQGLGGNVRPADGHDPWEAAMMVNFHAVVAIDELFLPAMLDRGRGAIVHLLSSAAVHGRAFPPYACAKAALSCYITSRGRTCLGRDVTVTALMPPAVEGDDNGWTQAAVTDPAKYERMRQGQACGRPRTTEEVAAAVVFLCGPGGHLFGGCVLPADATVFVQGGSE